MLKNLKYFSLLVVVFFTSGLIAQTVSLEQLQKLEQLTEAYGSSSDVVDEAQSPIPAPIEESDAPPVVDTQSPAFGYLGRSDSFIFAPNPKTRNEIRHFGYDFFVNPPSTYATSGSLSVPKNYIIGQGDVIRIVLYVGNRSNRYESSKTHW